MRENIHHRIKHLLEETNDAFASCAGGVNADYAAFASMSLSDFKNLLKNPELTGQELRRMIRKGEQKRRAKDPESCWASFIASYVAQNANQNQNLKKSVHYGLDKVYEEKSSKKS